MTGKRQGLRVFENGRLAYYLEPAKEAFWDRHWLGQFDPNIYISPSRGLLPDHFEKTFIRWLPSQGRIVDAGCGLGQHVLALRARGYDAEGIDSAPGAVELVRQARPDIPIRLGEVDRLDVPDGHYAGYISLGVVEHRRQGPDAFLKEAWRVLAPGGVGIISVPWCNAIRKWKIRLGRFQGVPGGQGFYQYAFMENEFKALLKANGFKVLEWSTYDPLKGLKDEISLLSWMLKRKSLGKLTERALGKLFRLCPAIARPLGHMMMVVVQKTGN